MKPVIGPTAVLLLALCSRNLFADPATNSATDELKPGDTLTLIGPDSLDEWTGHDGKDPNPGWVVTDGVLTREKKARDLLSKREFENYELRFEFQIAKGGNSGIKYRVKKYGRSNLGLEYQVLDDGVGNGKKPKTDHHSAAAIYALYAPAETKPSRPAGEWNTGRIVVNGRHIEHWLNGEKVLDIVTGTPDWHRRVKRSKFKKHDSFGENRSGRLLLQEHGGQVSFREMTLLVLPPSRRPVVAPKPTPE